MIGTKPITLVICCILACIISGCILGDGGGDNKNDKNDSVYELPIYVTYTKVFTLSGLNHFLELHSLLAHL